MLNILETIDKFTAEAKLMSIFKQLILLTNQLRPNDIDKICDRIKVVLDEEYFDKLNKRKGNGVIPRRRLEIPSNEGKITKGINQSFDLRA